MNWRTESFVARYADAAGQKDSCLCVGLDPDIKHLPPSFRTDHNLAGNIERYMERVINIAAPIVPVIKPQLAFYQALGLRGMEILERLIRHAQNRGLLVILDCKRSDIGSTIKAYGESDFGWCGADACTFVPYMGPTFWPTWETWLKQGKMVISMIRTSNDEAVTQDVSLKDGRKFFHHIGGEVKVWNHTVRQETDGMGAVGGVVGATFPEEAKECRQVAGDNVFFLIPGYGAQGGGAEGATCAILNRHKQLMGTVNSSRGITKNSWQGTDERTGKPKTGDPLEWVRLAIVRANEDLNAAIEAQFGISVAQAAANTVAAIE